jgi:amidase
MMSRRISMRQPLVKGSSADVEPALAKGKIWGPLHGVPVTIKEAFAYEGSANSWGRSELKDAKSPRTAVAVERLESAGAIVIGKTNIPTGLADIQSFNGVYGTTNNPWDLTRTPGGSTGGGAAAGLGPLSLGSDFGGSIRVPAHLCGVYGHKPTVNLVSVAGHLAGPWDGRTFATLRAAGLRPGEPIDRSFDMQVAGPLARDARDLELALSVRRPSAGRADAQWAASGDSDHRADVGGRNVDRVRGIACRSGWRVRSTAWIRTVNRRVTAQ